MEPHSVDAFELVSEEELTCPQPWWIEGQGFLHLFTKYTHGRELYFETSETGRQWTGTRKLAGIGGHYQVSSVYPGHPAKLGTFFNRHPGGDVDRRTDLYYAQTTDFGSTWTTADGTPLALPLEIEGNRALVIDYSSRARLQYTIDLNWDHRGNPVLLYLTSAGHQPGRAGEPRFREVAHWTGTGWNNRIVCRSDHNYDLGSVYVLDERWLIIGPTGFGPQAWAPAAKWRCGKAATRGRSGRRCARSR